MRIPGGLHLVAGLFLLVLASSDGRRLTGETSDVASSDVNSIQKPSLINLLRRFIPAKAMSSLQSAVAATASAFPQSRSLAARNLVVEPDRTGRKLKSTGKVVKKTKKEMPPPASVTSNKSSKNTEKTASGTKQRKQKARPTGPNIRNAGRYSPPPNPNEMEILTYDQKRNRLRQELVKETQDNCLAKILCGVNPNPSKQKEESTFASDSAYLIKEFFNIFDFTEEENKKKGSAQKVQADKDDDDKANADDKDEDDDEESDDEVDDIFRTSSSVAPALKNKKYSTNKPKNPHQTRTNKPEVDSPIVEISKKTKRPSTTSTTTTTTSTTTKPTTTTTARTTSRTTTTTSTTSTTTTPKPKRKPIVPISTEEREVVTPLSNVVTTTMISTSMTGTATLQPLDVPWEIPLQTAKDSDVDDDEEDDNVKYNDDDEDESKFHRVTLEELVGDIKLTSAEYAMLKRGRGMKIPLSKVTSSKFMQSLLRQLKMANSDSQKLQIAGRMGRSFRQARQCRQFSQVAEEVLQTCPLTTEVIRFFNTNLRNGTKLEVKRIPQGANSGGGGGLVLLNNDVDGAQHAYFVDNSPQVANTKITTDLKNPSIPTSFNEEESQYTVYEKRPNPNPQNSHLNQNAQDVRKRPQAQAQTKEATSNEDSEEESGEDAEADDADGDDEDEEEDDDGDEEEEDEEADDEGNDDDDNSQPQASFKKQPTPKNPKGKVDHEQIQGGDTNQPAVKVIIRPKPPKRTPPKPTLPPGIIRVYGVPQHSFDKDFSLIADQIGKPVTTIFGEEDIDRPAYKRRRQLHGRSSKAGHSADLEDDNVPYSSRIPKHPPLESSFSNDGDDDDNNKYAFQTYSSNSKPVGGVPLGGVKGADDDDDDDGDDDDKKVSGNRKKKNHGHDKDQSAESSSNPHFAPSMLYSVGIPQSQSYPHHQYFQPGLPVQPIPRPRVPYRPLVRPIRIIPDASMPITGMSFRPSPGREYIRPGRLYPLYHR